MIAVRRSFSAYWEQCRPPFALARMSLQRRLTYRRTTFLDLGTGLIWTAITYFLWQAAFTSHDELGGFNWGDMQAYVLVAFVLNSLLCSSTEGRVAGAVRTGQIVFDLLRPTNYLGMRAGEAAGSAIVEGAIAAVGAICVALVVGGVSAPPLLTFSIFVISAGLGFFVKFLIGYMTSLLCLFTLRHVGVLWVRTALTGILSGALVPVHMLPDVLGSIAEASPFPAIVFIPTMIFTQHLTGMPALLAVGEQFAWCCALSVGSVLLWRVASRNLIIQGG